VIQPEARFRTVVSARRRLSRGASSSDLHDALEDLRARRVKVVELRADMALCFLDPLGTFGELRTSKETTAGDRRGQSEQPDRPGV